MLTSTVTGTSGSTRFAKSQNDTSKIAAHSLIAKFLQAELNLIQFGTTFLHDLTFTTILRLSFNNCDKSPPSHTAILFAVFLVRRGLEPSVEQDAKLLPKLSSFEHRQVTALK